MSTTAKPIVIFVLGGPGAGKGTQCERIVEECIKRIMDRGRSSGRSDDNLDSLRKRFQTYKNSTMPIIEYYEKLGLLRHISGVPTVDE
ncbi:hypothetical protein QZH41_014928, partial [Actinostola sp. cb2023]